MRISRKDFLKMGAATGATVSLVLIGCGGDDDDYGGSGGSGGGSSSPCSADIVANHGHVLSIPAADLDATTDKTYDIQGSAPHTHSVTFTAAQMAELKGGASVTVTSSVESSHSHDVSVTCA
jgi:hypothetical protein